MPWILIALVVGVVVAAGAAVVALKGGAGRTDAAASGDAMLAIGVVFVGFGAISLVFDWYTTAVAIPIIGIVFIAVGARRRRAERRQLDQ